MAHDEVTGCVNALANELHARTILRRPEVEAITSRYQLGEARREALASLRSECFPAWADDLAKCAPRNQRAPGG
jgi:hypothetical protein